MKMNLFAYGTLMWPEVLEAVMGRRLTGVPTVLTGFKRLCVKGEHYPAVIQSLEDSVEGLLYMDLTAEEFQCLDDFEGEEYDRVEVRLGGTTAQVYVLSNDWKHLVECTVWRPEELLPEHLAAFCAEYKGWATRPDPDSRTEA